MWGVNEQRSGPGRGGLRALFTAAIGQCPFGHAACEFVASTNVSNARSTVYLFLTPSPLTTRELRAMRAQQYFHS